MKCTGRAGCCISQAVHYRRRIGFRKKRTYASFPQWVPNFCPSTKTFSPIQWSLLRTSAQSHSLPTLYELTGDFASSGFQQKVPYASNSACLQPCKSMTLWSSKCTYIHHEFVSFTRDPNSPSSHLLLTVVMDSDSPWSIHGKWFPQTCDDFHNSVLDALCSSQSLTDDLAISYRLHL